MLDSPDSYTLLPFFKLTELTLQITWAASEDFLLNLKEGELSALSHSIVDELKQAQQQDPLLQSQELPDLYSHWDNLVYYEGTRIYVLNQANLKIWILKGFHDSPAAGHFRWDRTLVILKRWFFWEDMAKFVEEYIKTCDVCLRTKINRKSPSGELMPILIPHWPWSHITMDFITDLPLSSNLGEH